MRASHLAVFFAWAVVVGHPSFNSAQDFTVQSTIRVGASPKYAAISHDGSRLFVANTGEDNVAVIDTRTGTILNRITVGSHPHGLLLSHDGKRLYLVVDRGTDGGCNNDLDVAIIVVDAAEMSVIQTIPFTGRTDALALTPDDKRLYLARVCHEVDYLDLPAVPGVELHPSSVTENNPGGYPVGLLISPDGRRMFVNYQGGGPYRGGGPNSDHVNYIPAHDALVEYDLSTGNIVRLQHSLPNVGDQIVLSPDGTQLWSNGADACSRPDYDHTGCPSVTETTSNEFEPSKVVSALRVSAKAQTTLTPLKTFGFSLLEFNGRISISPQGDVFVGGGISLKRIDPRSLKIVQEIELAGAGDVVFSPNGQTAYVTVSEKNEVDVLTRGKPANAAVQSEVAALPISMVDSVLLKQNCLPGQPCDVCAKSGSTCSAEGTPSELQAPILSEQFSIRGVSGPGGQVYKMATGDDLPCSLLFKHEQLTDAEANLLLTMVYRRDGYNVIDFEGKTSKSKNGVQHITARTGNAPNVDRFEKSLDEDAVYLTTILCHDRVETALFQQTGSTIVATAMHDDGKTPFTQKEVQDLVKVFKADLKDPCSSLDEIKKTGQALYNIIFPPDVLAAIRKREPHTLAWGLSDQLRYIPMGALWNGNGFLVEKYSNSLETPNSDWSESPTTDFIALAAGDSNQQGNEQGNGLSPLNNVPVEILSSFIPAAQTDNSKIPATILLDSRKEETPSDRAIHDTFTADHLQTQLSALVGIQRRRRIVHLASHFILKNTAADSYLLTESERLSFSDLSDKSKFNFKGIWLVTLSACETGVGVTAKDGSEVQSFASETDANGAMSTVATLWSVEDKSTSLLMQKFYANLLAHMQKGEALRQAQIDLRKETADVKYTPDDPARSACTTHYSHPYFWAPFVLIGSWH